MKYLYLGLILSALAPMQLMAKCDNHSLQVTSPSKFNIYHTDKEHKVITAAKGVSYEKTEDELSDSNYLYELSHKKDHDKKCTMYLRKTADKSFSLKQKDDIFVKSASLVNKNFTMYLEHESLSAIVCTGVQTVGDLKDVMDPYLSFSCKDTFAYNEIKKEGVMRLPASVTSSDKKPNH